MQTKKRASNCPQFFNNSTHYDAAGNITHITRDTTSVISYTYKHLDDYHIASVSNQRKKDGVTVTTTNRLDANGHLIETTDDAVGLDNHNRKLYVDTQGNILKKVQSNVTTRSLLVNGEIVGSRSNDGEVQDDINQSYQSLKESGSQAFVFKVPAGGTSLGNIAKMIWGDSSLWYKIAEANGLPDGAHVPENTLLNIPAREAANRNNTDTTKPYNSAKAIGDLTPVLPMPQGQDGGCGPVGTIVTIAVAAALTYFAPWAGEVWAEMAYAAIASTVGQAAAVAAGEQEKMNWKAVALSALSAGITQGVGANATGFLAEKTVESFVTKAMISNALSQGIGVATGLQTEPFRWKGVVAAGLGSAVSYGFTSALGNTTFNETLGSRMGDITRRTISSFAGGMTTAIARGGKVSAMQVFVDSFGNSIGQSYAADGVGELSPNEIRGLDFDDPKMVELRARSGLSESRKAVNESMAKRAEGREAQWIEDIDAFVPEPVKVDLSALQRGLNNIFVSSSGRVLRPSVQVIQGDSFFVADKTTFAGAANEPAQPVPPNPNTVFVNKNGQPMVRINTGVETHGTILPSKYRLYGVPEEYVTRTGQYPVAAYDGAGGRFLGYANEGGGMSFVAPPEGVTIDSLSSYELTEFTMNSWAGAKNTVNGLGNLGLRVLDSARKSFYDGNSRIGVLNDFTPWATETPTMTASELVTGIVNASPAGMAFNLGSGRPDIAGQSFGGNIVLAPVTYATAALNSSIRFTSGGSVFESDLFRSSVGENTSIERSYLGSSQGHQFAQEVLPGGTGTALTGHGEYVFGSGNVVVPKGTAITLPRDGIKILDETGRYIEAGDWKALAKAASENPRIASDIEGMTTWLPGSKVPNYTLSAPTNPPLRIFQNSTSVESRTFLDQLLQPNMGCVQWAACTKF